VAIDRASVRRELVARFDAFFPDGAGLIHPRFGDPEIVRADDAFAVELLRRDDAAAPRAELLGDDGRRWPLALVDTKREAVSPGMHTVELAARGAAPVGAYDLVVDGARARRCVWLRDADPRTPRALHVVQLSDLHVGKDPHVIEARLRRVIADVNALAPDLVVVTGDIVERGEVEADVRRAAELLAGVDAPVLTVMGGHDVGLSLGQMTTRRYGQGWVNHARAFHPDLTSSLTLGGWRFIGFDTGPVAGPGDLDRGLLADTVATLRAMIASARTAGLGVVLVSHAPTRSASGGEETSVYGRGDFARMRHGGLELEAAVLDAGAHGQRVLHLAGHTHWSDVFVEEAGPRGPRFARRPGTSACWRTLDGPAALVTTQAASQGAYGFAELMLDADGVRVAHHTYGRDDVPRRCDVAH
jgi:hypothetical protein